MGIFDIFKRDPEAVKARQEGRTARAEARAAARTAKAEAKYDPENVKTRTEARQNTYQTIHGSVSSVGSGILGLFGIDAPSQTERDIATMQAEANAAATVARASGSAPVEPSFLDKYGAPLGLAGLALVGFGLMGKGR